MVLGNDGFHDARRTTMSSDALFLSPKLSLECINREKITCLSTGVPTMFIAMLEHEDFPKTDFSYDARPGIMAGSPMSGQGHAGRSGEDEYVADYDRIRPDRVIARAARRAAWTIRSNCASNTVGRALPGVECKIVDPESRQRPAR